MTDFVGVSLYLSQGGGGDQQLFVELMHLHGAYGSPLTSFHGDCQLLCDCCYALSLVSAMLEIEYTTQFFCINEGRQFQ